MSAPTRTPFVPAPSACEESAVTTFAVPTVPTMATASVDGVPVAGFLSATRACYPGYRAPATVATVAVSVPLSRDELVAVLFELDYVEPEYLADAAYVRLLVAEAVVNVGMGRITDVMGEIDSDNLSQDGRTWLADCRAAVAAHFPDAPAVPAARRPRRTRVRGLVTA